MKKIYQTVVDPKIGNCAQAVIASLFELELDEVPNFILTHEEENMNIQIFNYFLQKGYDPSNVYANGNYHGKTLREIAEFDGGVDGYFYASVCSQTFEGGSHAVIVNKNLMVVHDPNPNQRCFGLSLEQSGLSSFISVKDWIMDKDGSMMMYEEYLKRIKMTR